MPNGQSLSARRRSAGLSLRQLAGRLGVTKQAVHRWERGTDPLPLDRARELAGIFKCRPADLLPRKRVKELLDELRGLS